MSRKSLEEEVRDDIYRLKLKALKESIYTKPRNDDYEEEQRQYTQLNPYFSKMTKDSINQKNKMKQIEAELEGGKNRYEKLKLKLKQQKMESAIASSVIKAMNKDDKAPEDNFSKFMEMMILQQNQTQNLVMNQLILRNQKEQTQYTFLPTIQNPFLPTLTNPPLLNNNVPLPNIDLNNTMAVNSNFSSKIPKKDKILQPFPGNDSQRSLRQLGLAAIFCSILEDNFHEQSLMLTDKFLFEVKIKEIMNTIEKCYTTTSKPIFSLINSLLNKESPKFTILLTRTGTNEELAFAEKELNFILQNIAAKIAEIMPSSGTLGCECKSILSEFIQNKQTFPENYFFNSEKILLQVDSNNMVHNVGFVESQLLLIGMFIVRTLVMHILMKSVEYNLCSSTTTLAQENLRILASLYMIVYKTILVEFITVKYPNEVKSKTSNIELTEVTASLLKDTELQPLLKVVKKSMDYVKTVILKWSETYVMKLRPI